MPKTKGLQRTVSKWAQNAGQASGSYADGVQNPRRPWMESTQAASENYKQGVTKAAASNSFSRGVQRAGNAKQQQNAMSKGVQRYSAGVAIAQPEFQSGMEGVLQAIENTVLPPRKAKGDPANLNRVKDMVGAMIGYKAAKTK